MQTLSTPKQILILTSITILLIMTAGCKSKSAPATPPVPIRMVKVGQYAGPETSKYSANILPGKTVPVAFKVGGYIQTLGKISGREIKEGDVIRIGMTLATLRSSDYQVKLDQAKANAAKANQGIASSLALLQQTKAGLQKAKLDFDRAQALYNNRALTKPDYDAARAQLDVMTAKVTEAEAGLASSQAQYQAAQAVVREAEVAFGDSRLTAPISGVIMKKMVEAGVLVGPGTPGFVLSDVRTVKVVFGVPDTVVQGLSIGQKYLVTTQSQLNQDYYGTITQIAPGADPHSRVFDVELSIPNLKGVLKPGMIATVELSSPKLDTPVMVVPLTCIVKSPVNPEEFAVYIPTTDNGKTIAQARSVTLGDTYGNTIAVLSGLQQGESVISDGAQILHEGDEIRFITQ